MFEASVSAYFKCQIKISNFMDSPGKLQLSEGRPKNALRGKEMMARGENILEISQATNHPLPRYAAHL